GTVPARASSSRERLACGGTWGARAGGRAAPPRAGRGRRRARECGTAASCPRWWRARSGRSSTARETSCWAARSRRCRRSRSLLLWPSVLYRCARGVIGRPFLRLELVERRPHRVRPEPLGAAVHVLNTRPSHDAVFPSARAAAGHVLPHVPRPLPPAARVGVGHLGQLVVREHRTSQAQEDTQATLKVVGREGQVVPHQG